MSATDHLTFDAPLAPHPRGLVHDDRGAVAILGLFLAVFLIGALWFLVGIGDAIVFRDKAQEVADSAAFTSTVVHAKGMNLIAALNLLMVAMTAIYLVLGILRDVAYGLMWAVCIGTLGIACPKAVKTAESVHKGWTSYAKVYRLAVEAMGLTQTTTARLAPFLGEAAAVDVAKKFDYGETKFTPLAVSPSMKPDDGGKGGGGGGGGARNSSRSKRLGLPVVKVENKRLCTALFDKFDELLTGKDFGRSPVASAIGVGVGWRYCGDGVNFPLLVLMGDFMNNETTPEWWKKETGPKAMYRPQRDPHAPPDEEDEVVENGGNMMQTNAFVFSSFKDQSEHLVALAGMDFVKKAEETQHIYTAQAEMYFDCNARWTDDDCNGSDEEIDNAIYAMNWRARLVRVRKLGRASDIVDAMNAAKAFGSIVDGGFDIDQAQGLLQAGEASGGSNYH